MAQLLVAASAVLGVGAVTLKWFSAFGLPQFVNKGLYHATLEYNKWRYPGKKGAFNIVHTDKRTGHRIVLSRIPDDETAYWLSEEFKEGFSGIYSCVQDELEWAGITTSFLVALGLINQPEDHHKVPMTDFCAEMDKLEVGRQLKDALEAFRTRGDILVHCKAGVGRSALFVAMLLVCLGVYRDLPDACEALKTPRIQVNVDQDKREVGEEILIDLGYL